MNFHIINSFYRSVRNKVPELISFLAMMVLFFTLVTCREPDVLNVPNSTDPMIQTKVDEDTIRGNVCSHKNLILSGAAMFLFSAFFGKFWRKYKEKKKKKEEFMKKRQAESNNLNKKTS